MIDNRLSQPLDELTSKRFDERFCELEAKIAFQENAVLEMSDVLIDQQNQIRQLETICKYLSDQVKLLVSELEQSSGHEKPPHY